MLAFDCERFYTGWYGRKVGHELFANHSPAYFYSAIANNMSLYQELVRYEKEIYMILKKSPGGSLFPYCFKNRELFCLHLGGFKSNETGVIARMKAEEDFIMLQGSSLPLWIDSYQTTLTRHVVFKFIETLKHIQRFIPKLGLVGRSFVGRWRIRRLIKKTEYLLILPVKYFEDPEIAKTWLVSETE